MALSEAKKKPCTVCARFPAEPHHIITRAAGGHDLEHNLMPLSRECHALVHSMGLNRFAEKYPQVKQWLLDHNWEFNEVLGKWRHDDKY